MKRLSVEPLTAKAFFEYGDVIEMGQQAAQPMNRGMADRFHALSTIEAYGDQAKAVISLIQSRKYKLPHTIEMVERHPLGSQAFIPFNAAPFIVIVAPAGDTVDPDQIRAFRSNGRQGINYRAGVWHGPLFTPFDSMTFVCIDRVGQGNNCEEWPIEPEAQLVIED
jgi:ureidoglycolate lyase